MSDSWQGQKLPEYYNRVFAFTDDEIAAYLAPLDLRPEDVFIDFGCGEGKALAAASRLARRVIGVDVSPVQLDLARAALTAAGDPSHAVFDLRQTDLLRFSPGSDRYSKGAARKALHHLPDTEKAEFFHRIGPAFPAGGLFYIEDGMFDVERDRLESEMPRIITEAEIYYGGRWPKIREDVLGTFRDEFPTSRRAWMNALRAGGFEPVAVWRRTCFYGGILARKE